MLQDCGDCGVLAVSVHTSDLRSCLNSVPFVVAQVAAAPVSVHTVRGAGSTWPWYLRSLSPFRMNSCCIFEFSFGVGAGSGCSGSDG